MAEENTERLMNALISKMETMDRSIQEVRAENVILRQALENPQTILRKAGYVQYSTPRSEDVEVDVFRGDMETTGTFGSLKGTEMSILKNSKPDTTLTNPDRFSNEEIHDMSWDEIHDMADQHREVKEMY